MIQHCKRWMLLACFLAVAGIELPSGAAQEPVMEPQLPANPLTRMIAGLNPANWKMPKLEMPSMSRFLPTKEEKKRVITKKNSLMDEVSTTAKKSWQRTKDTLNPMRLIPAGFKQNSTTSPAPKNEGGFFSNLFSPFPPREPADQTQSVTDWLKQDPVR